MNAKEFKHCITNAPFTRVTIPPHNRASLPDWIVEKMLEMEEHGFRYAFDVHNFPLQDPPIITTCQPPEVNFRRQRFVQKAIDTWINKVLEIEGSVNALCGLKITFMLGVDNYLRETGMKNKEVPSSFFIYNGLLNQWLPIFLLEITPKERRYFWSNFGNDLNENND